VPTTLTLDDVMADLEAHGSEQTKRTHMRHGAREPFFGVKIEHLKTIVKRVKKDHDLALALYDTGNADAMYLAALISDPAKFTKAQLNKWVKAAYCPYLSCYAVAWASAESRFGRELALEWMDSKKEQIAAAGWSTYASLLSITPDEELDHDEIVGLLERVEKGIHAAPNQVRYVMNGFVIAAGTFVPTLTAKAKATAKAVGKVAVDMGDTDCKVPDAGPYIDKVIAAGRHGKKRKTVMC
jgi:3-methyladenine DNA glycosylase AlkD